MLRKEEVQTSKGEPASGDRIEREKILDLSPKGASYGQSSTFKRIGAAIFSRATQRTGETKRLCPAHDGAVRRPNVCANVCVGLDEQRLGQLFPTQSCGRHIGPSCAQSGHRRAIWARFQQVAAALVGRSGRPALARASRGNATV